MPIGDFGDLLDSQTYTQMENQPPNLRKRTKNVVVLLTQAQANQHIYLRSIAIDDAGLITAIPLGFFEGTHNYNRDMGLLHWLDDVFVVYTNDSSGRGNLWTILCEEDGTFPAQTPDYLRIADFSNVARRSHLYKPHNGILLTAPSTQDNFQPLETVGITDAGVMPDSGTGSLAFANAFRQHRVRQAAGDRIISLASSEATYYIYSHTCTDAGVLLVSPSDTWGPIATAGEYIALCKISDTVFAVLVVESAADMQIHTFSIKANGDINKSWIDSEQVEASLIGHPQMVEMGGGYLLLAYIMVGVRWRLKSYFIAEDGTIQDGAIGTKDLTSGFRGNPWLEHLNGDIWTFTYEEATKTIRIDTIDVETPSVTIAHNELVFGIGP